MNKILNKVKGFTLIELLIVMAIMSTLGTLGFGSYMTSIQRSRDARRKADLNTIQKGLESHYNDNGSYPANITAANALCLTTINCYVRRIPTEPAGGASYCYVRGGTGQSFQLYAKLERTDDANYVNYGTKPAPCATGNWTYGISSTDITP